MTYLTDAYVVTPRDVWEGYLGLNRYFLQKGGIVKSGETFPKKGSPFLPEKYVEKASALAKALLQYDKEFPFNDSPVYYSYVYLFQQLLRVSYKTKPKFDKGRWRHVSWRPFSILSFISDTSERTWVNFCKSRIGSSEPLQYKFPWVPPVGVSEITTVQSQLAGLSQLRRQGVSIEDILTKRDITGNIRAGGPRDILDWHHWLIIAHPTIWKGRRLIPILIDLTELIMEPELWKIFIRDAIPMIHPLKEQQRIAKKKIMEHGDRMMMDVVMPVKERWRRARLLLRS